MLAKLHRAGELTPIWIPDAGHEAMRDLVRARATAGRVLSKARQHLQIFLLRHDQTLPRASRLSITLAAARPYFARSVVSAVIAMSAIVATLTILTTLAIVRIVISGSVPRRRKRGRQLYSRRNYRCPGFQTMSSRWPGDDPLKLFASHFA